MSDLSRKRKAMTIVADHEQISEFLRIDGPLVQDFPAAKRHRPCSHRAHADLFACEQATPMRSFRFDPTATGPAGQQASLERQGWAGATRERVALVCPNDDCGGLVMEFVAVVLLGISRTPEDGWQAHAVVLYDASQNNLGPADESWYHGLTAIALSTKAPFFVGAVDYQSDSYLDDNTQPWHGDCVSIFTPAGSKAALSLDELLQPGLVRTVLYRGRSGGHTVMIEDFDKDGSDGKQQRGSVCREVKRMECVR